MTGNDIRYRTYFGQIRSYRIEDITSVSVKQVGEGLRYRFYSGEQKLFTVDENTDDIYLVERLKDNGVRFTEKK